MHHDAGILWRGGPGQADGGRQSDRGAGDDDLQRGFHAAQRHRATGAAVCAQPAGLGPGGAAAARQPGAKRRAAHRFRIRVSASAAPGAAAQIHLLTRDQANNALMTTCSSTQDVCVRALPARRSICHLARVQERGVRAHGHRAGALQPLLRYPQWPPAAVAEPGGCRSSGARAVLRAAQLPRGLVVAQPASGPCVTRRACTDLL